MPFVANDLKHTEATVLPILMDPFALQVAQGPKSPKLVIFMLMTTDIQCTNRSRVEGSVEVRARVAPRYCTQLSADYPLLMHKVLIVCYMHVCLSHHKAPRHFQGRNNARVVGC